MYCYRCGEETLPNEQCSACKAWDSADFYSLTDHDEDLKFTEVEDLLGDYVDWSDMAEYPVTVYAWKRRAKPTDREVLAEAKELVEFVEDWWHSDWGDPSGESFKGSIEEELCIVLQNWVDSQVVWSCEIIGKREVGQDGKEVKR